MALHVVDCTQDDELFVCSCGWKASDGEPDEVHWSAIEAWKPGVRTVTIPTLEAFVAEGIN